MNKSTFPLNIRRLYFSKNIYVFPQKQTFPHETHSINEIRFQCISFEKTEEHCTIKSSNFFRFLLIDLLFWRPVLSLWYFSVSVVVFCKFNKMLKQISFMSSTTILSAGYLRRLQQFFNHGFVSRYVSGFFFDNILKFCNLFAFPNDAGLSK